MPDTPTHVNPGELITAELMNTVLQRLDQYEARIINLENGGGGLAPLISGFVPTGPVRVGTQLQVLGQNFARPADSNIVTVGGFIVDRFDIASNDARLIFNVPQITFTGAQLNSQITVRTKSGAASANLVLLPAVQIPTGLVVFSENASNGQLGTIATNQTYTWLFNLDSQTLIAESYELSLVLSNATGQVPLNTWRSSMTLVRPDGSPLPMPMVCEPAKPVSFGMRVTIPVAATVGSSITMAIRARSLNNDLGLSRNSDPITIEVGRVTPVSDPRVQWANEVPGNPLHTPARAARRVTDPASGKEYVEIPYEGTGLLRLRASFQSGVDSGGDFVYATTFNSAVEGVWQADPPSPLTSIGKQPGENELIGVILHLRAKETNNHPEERVLTLRATRTLGGTLESFVTVNIRGYAPN